MIIHTNLTFEEFGALVATPKLNADVFYDRWTESGSRTHARKFDLLLAGIAGPTAKNGARRRRTNSGQWGAGYEWAATFDEWGWFLAALFDADPAARCGSTTFPVYANREDFHDRTHGVYRPIGAERSN